MEFPKRSWVAALVLGAGLALPGAARAENDSCREWRRDHCDAKAEVLRRYLKGAPQRELDAAMFELLRYEAYLTSCDTSLQHASGSMVGWRLVGRTPDEYPAAVAESILERAGFDLELRDLFATGPVPPPNRYARHPRGRSSR